MKKLFTLLVLQLSIKLLLAQPGALDLRFDPGTGANGMVKCAYVLPDQKILICGKFTSYNGTPVGRMARLHPNGTLDTTFNIGSGFTSLPGWPGIGSNVQAVNSIALQADGKILVAGSFDTINGQFAGRIVRLHPDGAIDTSFHTGRGIGTIANKIVVQPDQKIVIGGIFSTYDSLPYNYIVRINPDGSVDTTWNAGPGANGSVDELALQPDGKILIGGDFTMYGGNGVNYLQFRLARANTDGSRDITFSQAGASRSVLGIALRPDDHIVIGGRFTYYESVAHNGFAILLPGGTLDAFQTGTGANEDVEKVCLLNNGNILLAGNFTSFNNNPAGRVARLLSNGTFDSNFNTGTGANDHIYAMALQSSTNGILIGGDFTSYNGISRHRIARLYNCLTPQPDSIYGNPYALCSGTPQTYSVTPISGATKYEWTLPNGWSGSSDSASITATGTGSGGSISVKAFTDSCGWSYTTTRTIATIQPPSVPICLVTVDEQSTHNIILWEKPLTTTIDSFFIYRETSNNVYTKVGAVGYSDLSEYHDDTTANPNTTSYRYKLSVLDTCGAESELSPFHRTIHLQKLGNGNFQWTFYQIQGQSNPVISFNINRDNLGNGNYFPVGNVPGTNATFTDITFNAFTNSQYVVDVNWSISCDPTRQVNTTRSNIRKKTMIDFPLGLSAMEATQGSLLVYPNPARETIRLQFSDGSRPTVAYLVNALGEKVVAMQAETYTLDVSSLPKGIYLVYAASAAGVYKARVCVH